MSNLIIVDRLIGNDRWLALNGNTEKTSYELFNQTTIEIPEKMQIYLINTLLKHIDSNMSVKRQMEYLSCAIYCSFFTIKRYLVDNGYMTWEESMVDRQLYFKLYTYVNEAVNTVDFTDLYDYLKDKDNIHWTKLCGVIQGRIRDYVLPKIIG